MEAELFYTDGRTDGQDEDNSCFPQLYACAYQRPGNWTHDVPDLHSGDAWFRYKCRDADEPGCGVLWFMSARAVVPKIRA